VAKNRKMDKRLKRILVTWGVMSAEDADAASAEAEEAQKSLATLLVEKEYVEEKSMLGVISREAGIPPIDLGNLTANEELAEVVPKDVAEHYDVVPVSKVDNILTLAVADPFDFFTMDEIRILTGCEIRPVLSTEGKIKGAIGDIYNKRIQEMEDLLKKSSDGEMILKDEIDDEEIDEDLAKLIDGDDESPVVKIVNLIIMDAIRAKASDIHIEPFEKKLRIRFRTDGVLHEVPAPPKKMHMAIVSRIKVMSQMDIAEKRKPQDGKIKMQVEGRHIDFRVSVLPMIHGEKVVLRILDSSSLVLNLETLGFEPKCLEDFRWAISQPYGMILVTGPTGSGKTTTLYSALREIMSSEDNVITVEEPVEYQLEGINQVPVNAKRGLTFAAALRSILRQDPDKIMIGELRDLETSEIAVKAALTGHLVLSTLHTNDAAQAITRLVDMGVESFLVAATGLLTTAQRLARKLCGECKAPMDAGDFTEEKLVEMQFQPEEIENANLFKAVGCPRCRRGYKGRLALVEALKISEPIKKMIIQGRSSLDLKNYAKAEEGMVTLRRAGILKVMRGETSLEELERVTMAD
jgi:type IV pilus assembly protein PilB